MQVRKQNKPDAFKKNDTSSLSVQAVRAATQLVRIFGFFLNAMPVNTLLAKPEVKATSTQSRKK